MRQNIEKMSFSKFGKEDLIQILMSTEISSLIQAIEELK